MKIIGIIPARMSSTRFPGKPLAKILGIPMIGHVYLRSRMSKILNDIYIATCDKEIAEYAESIGAKLVMTKKTHKRASDRAAEALIKIERRLGEKIDIVVMIQGDEPMVYPEMIDCAVRPMLKDKTLQVVNLMGSIKSKKEQVDPNTIKVVVDRKNFAIYFSREPIPSFIHGSKETPMFKQICIIPFRRNFLLKFNALSPMPLEIAESIDMLRVLEHGYKVKMVLTKAQTQSVDNKNDLKKASGLLTKDKIFNSLGPDKIKYE